MYIDPCLDCFHLSSWASANMLVLTNSSFIGLHRRQLQRGDTVQSKEFELGQLRENHHAEPARFATIGFQEKASS
jgi:hypothetical protein